MIDLPLQSFTFKQNIFSVYGEVRGQLMQEVFRLVATLGSKSNTKKVTRKAILDVNLQKACETIIEPEAPMALRLQSNLLYGVTRVYNQKWDYLLYDTQIIQSSIRTLLNSTKSNQIDKNAGKARPDQLILEDDPAFLVDEFLEPPPIEFDNFLHGDSIHSSQSVLSIRERSCSPRSQHKSSPPGLEFPSSSNGSMGSYHLPIHDPFEEISPVARSVDFAKINNNDEQMLLQNDDLFEIDDNGEIHELPGIGGELSDSENIYPKLCPDNGSAANGRVRREHKDAMRDNQEINLKPKRGGDTRWHDSDNVLINDKPVALDVNGTAGRSINPEVEDVSHLSLEAPHKHKKAKTKKNIIITDISTELGSSDINKMTADYCANMIAQAIIKSRVKMNFAHKKNAFHFVFGAGINKIGYDPDKPVEICPLASYSGEALKARILGPLAEAHSNEKKRALSGMDLIGDIPVNKRAHYDGSDLARRHSSHDDHENIILIHSHDEYSETEPHDKSMEIGREVASALPDHPISSSRMPWNTTTSGHFSRPGSSIHQRYGSRLTSASPLMGRSSTLPKDLSNVFLDDQNDMIIYNNSGAESKRITEGRHDQFHSSPDTRVNAPLIHSSRKTARHFSTSQDVKFDITGPTVNAKTQIIGASQWVTEVLDSESYNFLEYLQGKMIEINEDIHNEENSGYGMIRFTKLLLPEQTTSSIAAQAFYHVLSLANKNMIHVQQLGIQNGFIDGDIYISVL